MSTIIQPDVTLLYYCVHSDTPLEDDKEFEQVSEDSLEGNLPILQLNTLEKNFFCLTQIHRHLLLPKVERGRLLRTVLNSRVQKKLGEKILTQLRFRFKITASYENLSLLQLPPSPCMHESLIQIEDSSTGTVLMFRPGETPNHFRGSKVWT